MNVSIVQSMIDSIDKPAIFITPDYTILAVNDLYRDTYETEVVRGSSRCFEISHGHAKPCDQHGEKCPIQETAETGRASSVMHIHKTDRGQTYCDILMRPVKDSDGMTVGYLEILDQIQFASAQSEANKMIGSSKEFKQLLSNINRAAKSEIAVLLQGETGTGKELVAKALHEASRRTEQPFVVIECTGLNENLFESELFGHEKGSFTGANQKKKGLIEIANGGTVFFDEIADVPLSMQVKLLRLLETQCYRTVGGLKQHKVDFRVICASHKNLLDLVDKGEFRKDLYYRIAGFPISLPSLSERASDIATLAEHFLQQTEHAQKSFTAAALLALQSYSFPGNIRELRSIVEQSALLANEDLIDKGDLPDYVLSPIETKKRLNGSRSNMHEQLMTIEDAEKQYLSDVCEHQSLPIDSLAEALGVSSRTLYRKLQKFGLKYDERA